MRKAKMDSAWMRKERLSWKQGPHAMTHLKNGDKYIGDWKDDMMDGVCVSLSVLLD
jgi:hypothetical protein